MEATNNRVIVVGIVVICLLVGFLVGMAIGGNRTEYGSWERRQNILSVKGPSRYEPIVKHGDFRIGDGSLHHARPGSDRGDFRASVFDGFHRKRSTSYGSWESLSRDRDESYEDSSFTPEACRQPESITYYSQILPDFSWKEFESYCQRLGIPLG